jgi:cation transport regulator ChaC
MDDCCDQKKYNKVWYFAYGSNLYKPQMQARVGECEKSKKAYLKGWRLIFNVYSKRWSGGTANITKTDDPRDVVYGVIYPLSLQQLEILTKYESVSPKDIQVLSEGKHIDAKTYIFKQDKPPQKPASQYVETIISGLKQHDYGEDVIQTVRNPVRVDQTHTE